MSANELTHPIRVDTLGETPRTIDVIADATERVALAARFGLVAVDRLEATAEVRREGADVIAAGRVGAAIVQSCAATGDPLPVTIDEPFALRFVADGGETGDEIELAADDLDIISYAGGAIDLGEAVAETLGLAIDPFLRKPGADAELRAAGVLQEGEAGPFAALKALKGRLG